MMSYPKNLPVLTPEVDRMYSVPPSGNVEIYYTGLPLDEIEDRLITSNAWKAAVPLLLPKQEVAGGTDHATSWRPRRSAGNSRYAEWQIWRGEQAHLAHWRPIKHTTTTVESKTT